MRRICLIGIVALLATTAYGQYWVDEARSIHANYEGPGGLISRFGDSISYSQASFSPLQWNHANATPADQEAQDWLKGYMAGYCWAWQNDTSAPQHGCYSGWTTNNAIQTGGYGDPGEMNITYWLRKDQPEMAIIMWGTNDIRQSFTPTQYKANLQTVIDECKTNGTIPIISTIPPCRGYEPGQRMDDFVTAVRELATENSIPLIDYYDEIMTRRPTNWDGTLISGDGVHPSNTSPTQDFSPSMLATNGYTLRNWLSLHALHDVYQEVMALPGEVSYQIRVNGQEVNQLTMADVNPGEDVTVEIWGQTSGDRMALDGGGQGGVLQYSVNLSEDGGAIEPVQSTNFLGNPDGYWDSSSEFPLGNFKGEVDSSGFDVYGQTGAISPGDFETNRSTFGAGTWSKLGEGVMTWNGGDTTLTLEPGTLASHLIYSMYGVDTPTAVFGDSLVFVGAMPGDADKDADIDAEDLAALGLNWDPAGSAGSWATADFDADGDVDAEDLAAIGLNWSPAGYGVPEPASMSLLVLGGLAILRRRK